MLPELDSTVVGAAARKCLLAALLAIGGHASAAAARQHLAVSPLNWGAKVDGRTDARAAFQAAVNYAAAEGGGTVSIPVGTSYIRSSAYLLADGSPYGAAGLVVPSNVRLKGSGPSSRILCQSDWGPGAFYGCIRGKAEDGRLANIEISSFTLDGGYRSGPSGQISGILIAGGSNIYIHDLAVQNFSQQGIQVIGLDYGYHSAMMNGDRAYDFTAFDPSIVRTGSEVIGEGVPVGTTVKGSADGVLLLSNSLLSGRRLSLHIVEPNFGVRVLRNQVSHVAYIGIQIQYPYDAQISENIIDNTGDNCIDLYGDNGGLVPTSRRWAVERNTLTRCGDQGIFLETVANGKVDHNLVSHTNSGVWINQMHGHPNNLTVTKNSFAQVASCVHVGADGAVGIEIAQNICDGFTRAGLDLSGTGINATGNIFRNSAPNVPIYRISHVHYSKIQANKAANVGRAVKYDGENGGNQIVVP